MKFEVLMNQEILTDCKEFFTYSHRDLVNLSAFMTKQIAYHVWPNLKAFQDPKNYGWLFGHGNMSDVVSDIFIIEYPFHMILGEEYTPYNSLSTTEYTMTKLLEAYYRLKKIFINLPTIHVRDVNGAVKRLCVDAVAVLDDVSKHEFTDVQRERCRAHEKKTT